MVLMALDIDSFEPGPVYALSLHFNDPYGADFRTVLRKADQFGGRLDRQSSEGSLFYFPTLQAAKDWFRAVTSHPPALFVQKEIFMARKEDQFLSELPAFALQIYPA